MTRYANYISRVMCANCRKMDRIKIPVGRKIEDRYCHHCGLKELHHLKYFFTDDFYYNKMNLR